MLTQRYADALQLAWRLHDGQLRKGTSIPYVSHLLAVSSLALEHGASEDEAIAALLHDAVEDAGGRPTLEMIRARFGAAVADIVEGCTDSYEEPKPEWRPRKEAYLAHVAQASRSVRLVSASDKLHNARSILSDRPENNERVRFLSDEERERLFLACRASKWPMMFAAVLLAIVTGARKGEMMRLRWRDADLDAGVIVVPGKTKNNDNKTLVLTANAVEELRRHVGRPEALIFASKITPDKPFNFAASAWPRALRQANIRNLKWHDLRHTCASYLAQSGATLLQIADVLGHRNLSVTRRYSHLTVGHRRKLVDDVLGGLK